MSFIILNWYIITLAFVIAYLLGSLNTAVIVTGIFTKGGDIRKMGSGNAGFTNVLRSVGKLPAILTIVCDLLKSVLAVVIGGLIFSYLSAGMPDTDAIVRVGKYLCGFFCIVGHSYPVFFKFKGGKGIVTAAATMLVTDWRVFVMILATFLIIFICSKIISLASIICAALFPLYTFIMCFFIDYLILHYELWYVFGSVATALLISIFVIIKHASNIKRLINGEEKKITAKK